MLLSSTVVLSLFSIRNQFHGRQFFQRRRWGMVSGCFKCIAFKLTSCCMAQFPTGTEVGGPNLALFNRPPCAKHGSPLLCAPRATSVSEVGHLGVMICWLCKVNQSPVGTEFVHSTPGSISRPSLPRGHWLHTQFLQALSSPFPAWDELSKNHVRQRWENNSQRAAVNSRSRCSPVGLQGWLG